MTPYAKFMIGCIVVIVICLTSVGLKVSKAIDFEKACEQAGGIVTREGIVCIERGAIIEIEVE
jgi:hypothetical protein